MGRALSGSQTLGSQTYSMSYSYDPRGACNGINLPFGRTVSYAYDSAGRTSSVTAIWGMVAIALAQGNHLLPLCRHDQ